MKIHELSLGFRIPISNEEHLLLEKIKECDGCIAQSQLDERQREVARALTHKAVLTRCKIKSKIHYRIQDADSVRRI